VGLAVPIDIAKIDRNLLIGYQAWEEAGSIGDASLTVNLHFAGDLAPIEAAGFQPDRRLEGLATGVVRFADLAALTGLEAVEFIGVGSERQLDLDTALLDIRARSTTDATVGVDGLWHADASTGTLTGAPSDTGEDVIVAVIDTGIDFTHPHFMSQVSPTKATRILRIWDQGLTPAAVSDCPDATLLVSNPNTYGVEYDKAEIDAHLTGGTRIAHRDCEGHGTHCASIAAGGTVFDAGGSARIVGAAPKADIIAVKLMDNPSPINFFSAAGTGAEVAFERRFQDAILYCLRVAKSLGKPVVVSISLGNPFEPGDGLDDSGRFVDDLMDPTAAASNDHFPTGAVICKSSGNNASPARRTIARIEIPAGGEVTVPLKLDDRRVGTNNKFRQCANSLYSPAIMGTFWYRRTSPFTAIEFAVKMAGRATFSGDMGVGGNLDQKFVTRPGPPMTSHIVPDATPNTFGINAFHAGNPSVPHPLGGTIRRHDFSFWITPKVVGGAVEYPAGIYEVRIRAPAGTEIFFSGSVAGWAPGKGVVLSVASTMADGTALPAPPDLEVTSEFSTTDPLGRHVLTVGAYDDANGNSGAATFHHIAKFSSRGPLRDYRAPAVGMPVLWQKPDIAAPGVAINAALGFESHRAPAVHPPPWARGNRWVELGGTSMATPMVAGVVALMMSKKNDLNVDDVRNALAPPNSKPPVDPPPGTAGKNAYGDGRIDAFDSHNSVP